MSIDSHHSPPYIYFFPTCMLLLSLDGFSCFTWHISFVCGLFKEILFFFVEKNVWTRVVIEEITQRCIHIVENIDVILSERVLCRYSFCKANFSLYFIIIFIFLCSSLKHLNFAFHSILFIFL